MDLQQLRYVVALSEELHFAKAAQKTHVTQPTLSQQVKKLEDELGAPLFERSPRRVRLTPAGERFLPYARQILSSLERGVEELKEASGSVSGRVRVSAIPTICPYLLPEVIAELRKKAPRVELELYEETTSVLLGRLREGGVDIGILSPPVGEKGLSEITFVREKFFLAVPLRHRLALKASVTARDLEQERLLMLQEGHCFGGQSLEYCKTAVKNPQVIFRGSSLLSVMRLAASGEGVTFVPSIALPAGFPKGLKMVPFARPEPSREIGAVWRVTSPLTRAHRLVMDLVSSAASRLAVAGSAGPSAR